LKGEDLLSLTIFKYPDIFLFQITNEPLILIRSGEEDVG
jgi:hypothetical protein